MVQFRKSKKVGPFRFTLTKRGFSTSAGAGPLRISKGADGKLRRTLRVPGVGLYDTKVIGRPRPRASKPQAADASATASSTESLPGPQPMYGDGQIYNAPPPKPPLEHRVAIIGGSILAVLILLLMLGNCGGRDNDSVATTVTRTVTAEPSTVTVTASVPTSVVTVTEQAPVPPPSTTTVTETQAATAPGFYQPPASDPVPPSSTGAYYSNCTEARAAGAAPLYTGEPGYRPGLDRDNDGVACES
jgi:hypothetical protein